MDLLAVLLGGTVGAGLCVVASPVVGDELGRVGYRGGPSSSLYGRRRAPGADRKPHAYVLSMTHNCSSTFWKGALMALACFTTGDADKEIAHQIDKALTDGPLTSFREQLLDVIRANAEDLYDYAKGRDDEDV